MDIVEIVSILLTSWLTAGVANYLADVLPTTRSLVLPFCHYCRHPLNVFYYILWPAKCPACGTWVGIRHWIVRLGFLLVGMLVWFNREAIELELIPALIVIFYFILVSIIDIEHRLILHHVSLAGAILGAIIGINLHGIKSTLLGSLAGFLCLFIMYLFGSLFVRWLARLRHTSVGEDALGFGDVILGGVLGLFLGLPGIFFSIVLAILGAGAASLIYVLVMLLRSGYHANLTIPYGPFLVFGAFSLLFLKNILLSVFGW